jgi:hypothetical protein
MLFLVRDNPHRVARLGAVAAQEAESLFHAQFVFFAVFHGNLGISPNRLPKERRVGSLRRLKSRLPLIPSSRELFREHWVATETTVNLERLFYPFSLQHPRNEAFYFQASSSFMGGI